MLGDPERKLVEPSTSSIEAYELYLQGRALIALRGPHLRTAVARLESAVALDADFAEAHAGLAESLALLVHQGVVRPREVSSRANEASSRAIALAPAAPEGHLAHALCQLIIDFDREAARDEFDRALSLGPLSVSVLTERMHFLHIIIRGRYGDAIAEGNRAIALDPLNAFTFARLANAHMLAGQHGEAVSAARRSIELAPLSNLARQSLVFALGESGDLGGALIAVEEVLAMTGRHPWGLAFLAWLCDQAGDEAGAASAYGEAVARSGREYVQPTVLAATAAAAKRPE